MRTSLHAQAATFVAALFAFHSPVKAAAPRIDTAIYGKVQSPVFSNVTCNAKPEIDLTAAVRAACKSSADRCRYTVPTPSLATDPGFGCYKSFTAKYTCSPAPQDTQTVSFGGTTREAAGLTATFNCSAPKSDAFARSAGLPGGRPTLVGVSVNNPNWTLTGYFSRQLGSYTLSGPQDASFYNNYDREMKSLNYRQAMCLLVLPKSTPGLGSRDIQVTGEFDDSLKTVQNISSVMMYFNSAAVAKADTNVAHCLKLN